MFMNAPLLLLLPWLLVSQEPELLRSHTPDLQMTLGVDPLSQIHLAPTGCWDGLLLGAALRPEAPVPQRSGEATVAVWDLLPPTSPRGETFALYLATMRERLSKAWLAPPPKHQAIELCEVMSNDPSTPQKLDLTKVISLQGRFNRMPPAGSPVK